jgi:hypothetical protein
MNSSLVVRTVQIERTEDDRRSKFRRQIIKLREYCTQFGELMLSVHQERQRVFSRYAAEANV